MTGGTGGGSIAAVDVHDNIIYDPSATPTQTSLYALQFVNGFYSHENIFSQIATTSTVSTSTNVFVRDAQSPSVIPITSGGTNATTALSNGRVMISAAGAIVEVAATTNAATYVVGSIVTVSTGATQASAARTTTYADANLTRDDLDQVGDLDRARDHNADVRHLRGRGHGVAEDRPSRQRPLRTVPVLHVDRRARELDRPDRLLRQAEHHRERGVQNADGAHERDGHLHLSRQLRRRHGSVDDQPRRDSAIGDFQDGPAQPTDIHALHQREDLLVYRVPAGGPLRANPTTKTWSRSVLANLADYFTLYTEIDSTGVYVGLYPDNFLLDVLPIEASYQQQGVSPALPDDLPIASLGSSQGASVAAITNDVVAASNLAKNAASQQQGVVQTGANTTSQIVTLLTGADNVYNGRVLILTSGAQAKQTAIVTGFVNSTGILSFTPIASAPTPGDSFLVA